ncbi:MAG: aminopeptidase [bacterium]|nr:aminopeptidase [bacterium]
MSLNFEQKLENYAELAVKIGVGLQPGQRLLLRSSVECAPLARMIVDKAYKAGARLVDVLWSDDAVTLSRFANAPADSFDEISTAVADAMDKGTARGDAVMSIFASDPDLLKDQDPAIVAQVQKNSQKYSLPVSRRISAREVNWNIIAAPIPAWATKVFPEATSTDDAVSKLWDAIFNACRADLEDPVGAWRAHTDKLKTVRQYLNDKQYVELRYRAPGTDLVVGLPENHIWSGGESTSQAGIPCVPNMPTEEVFTLPHREKVEGVVSSTKPLSYAGSLIEDFQLRFESGRVVEVKAARCQDVLQRLIDTDEGSTMLGEVALVTHGSPISQSGLLFYNTLFDENASSHFAVGRAYQPCLKGGVEMSDDEFNAAGGNTSLTHVDFMVGSAEMDVDGVLPDGAVEPLMRGGEWAFSLDD